MRPPASDTNTTFERSFDVATRSVTASLSAMGAGRAVRQVEPPGLLPANVASEGETMEAVERGLHDLSTETGATT